MILLLSCQTNSGTFHLQTICCIKKVKVFVAEVIVTWIFLLVAVKSILIDLQTLMLG